MFPQRRPYVPSILGPGGDVINQPSAAQKPDPNLPKPIVYILEFFAAEKPVEPTQDHPELKGEERLFCTMRDMSDPHNPQELSFSSEPLISKETAAAIPALSRDAQIKRFFDDMAQILYTRSQAHKL